MEDTIIEQDLLVTVVFKVPHGGFEKDRQAVIDGRQDFSDLINEETGLENWVTKITNVTTTICLDSRSISEQEDVLFDIQTRLAEDSSMG